MTTSEPFHCLDSGFTDFCVQLLHSVPLLTLWAASIFHGRRPQMLTEASLTEPLRSPPSITAEVEKANWFSNGSVKGYSGCRCPLPSDGPAPLYLYHTPRQPHSPGRPHQCQQCGRELARALREDLHVGVTGVYAVFCNNTVRGALSHGYHGNCAY